MTSAKGSFDVDLVSRRTEVYGCRPLRITFGFGDRMVRRTACVLLAVVAALLTGCVERRFRVETNPPGAYVTVNNKPIGPSPVDVPFLYYGHYDILIQKEGYQTQRIREHVKAPWYGYPPFDLVVENFFPFEVQDFRVFCYEMQPAIVPNAEQLKAEGDGYRQRAAALPAPRYPEEPKEKDKRGPPPPSPAVLPPPREPTLQNTSPPSPPG
jgi:PEGA domain